MLKIGLTGNIGSGKSLVCNIFESTGVPVFHADEIGHAALQDSEIHQELTHRYGPSILRPDGSLNRRALAEIVFNDSSALEHLNSLVHPFVKRRFDEWCSQHTSAPFIIHEAAILFESGFNRYFDSLILVTAPEVVRLQRVMTRDGLNEAEVKARMARQWPEKNKLPLVDYVIVNDGYTPLVPQVDNVLRNLAQKVKSW
ncbi:MAG: dephospho-CoA kinase [Bacteroidales bacterium]